MPSVLDHYNNYKVDSKPQWDGIKSSRFGRTKVFLPHKDLIQPGLDFPNIQSSRGMKHYSQKNSPEKQFRSILKITPKGPNWHPRESKKKVFEMSFTEPHARRERGHNTPDFLHTDRTAGIRTFYNTKIREENVHEYSVQDKMQRKQRVDQGVLRKTFFSKEGNTTFW